MAKILIALTLLVAVTAAFFTPASEHFNSRERSFGVCRPQQCVNQGAVCDYVIYPNTSATTRERWCKGGEFCKVANTTTDITGVCAEYAEVGQACTTSNDCEGDLSCVNKFCNRGYYPGAKCKVSNDCLYFGETGDQVVNCASGRCAGLALNAKCSSAEQSCLPPNACGPDNTCIAPGAAGAKCDANTDCQIAFWCSNATCAARVASAGACDVASIGDDQCATGLTCIPNAQTGADAAKGTCRAQFIGAAGAICTDDIDCNEGLTCLDRASGSTNIFGACGPTVASSRRACNASASLADNANVCSANEQCFCNNNNGNGACYSTAGVAIAKGAKKAWESLYKCGEKCGRTDWNCIEKCEGKICNYQHKLYATSERKGNTLECAVDDFKVQLIPGYVECSAASFVQLSLVGMVAVVAALLF